MKCQPGVILIPPNFSCSLAIKYILHLQYLLSFPPGQKIPSHIVQFDPSVPAWERSKNIPGAVSLADFEASINSASSAAFAANQYVMSDDALYFATGQDHLEDRDGSPPAHSVLYPTF